MIEYLDIEDLLDIARAAVGEDVAVRDYGLLESALARPRASVFGGDAYPDLHLKAAALMHSLAWSHTLVDGNKRLAWTACRTFLAVNGQWISAPEDDRFEFVIGVATAALPDLGEIAEQLHGWSYPQGESNAGERNPGKARVPQALLASPAPEVSWRAGASRQAARRCLPLPAHRRGKGPRSQP